MHIRAENLIGAYNFCDVPAHIYCSPDAIHRCIYGVSFEENVEDKHMKEFASY